MVRFDPPSLMGRSGTYMRKRRPSEVTILFIDLCNFPDLIAGANPLKVIQFLDNVFRAFDRCLRR